MKVNELRVGNWVTDETKSIPYQIRPQDFWPLSLPQNEGNANPIPLTPEILVKAGFEKYMPMKYRLIKGWHWITVDTNSVYINEKQVAIMEHLHQLQSLYFALTGEELNVEL